MSDWRNIKFAVNLLDSAFDQIDFLRDVDTCGLLYSGKYLHQALYRYEKFWIHFYMSLDQKGKNVHKYYPPLDIAWVWHCHMLCPTEYAKDYQRITGKVLDHKYNSKLDRFKKQENTKQLWTEFTGVSFDFMSEDAVDSGYDKFTTGINYDIIAAADRQKSFYYQVSLPHFQSKEYLNLALDRYKKFLFLKKSNPSAFVVPCYGIDIMWHTHQLYPLAYANETNNLLGFVFPHDDTVNDRTPGSKLCRSDQETRGLWTIIFNENFFFPGGMFRGEPTSSKHFDETVIKFSDFFSKKGHFSLEHIQITHMSKMEEDSIKFKIIVRQNFNPTICDLTLKVINYFIILRVAFYLIPNFRPQI